MKKLIAFLMAMTLIFALAMPAYAAGNSAAENTIVDYGWLIFTAVVCLIVVVAAVITFFRQPSGEQKKKIKEWLLFAVFEAERYLGGGTGQLKLRLVYDWFVSKFPWAVNIVPFETFAGWVDEALEQMAQMLENNEDIAALLKPATPETAGTTE